jgi:hypothetical protein
MAIPSIRNPPPDVLGNAVAEDFLHGKPFSLHAQSEVVRGLVVGAKIREWLDT